jgi:hypothetical protein
MRCNIKENKLWLEASQIGKVCEAFLLLAYIHCKALLIYPPSFLAGPTVAAS